MDTLKDINKSVFSIIVRCKALQPELKIDNKEIEAAKFFAINELPLDNILDIHMPIVDKYFRGLR
jgi:hypothetical protein